MGELYYRATILSVCVYVCVCLFVYEHCVVCVGLMSGHKILGVRMILEDGAAHLVDSSEMAFKLAARGAMRTFFFDVS